MYVCTYPICILHEHNFSNQTRTRIRIHTHTQTLEHTTRTHTQTQASMYVCMSRNCVLCFVHARKRDNMTSQQPQ